MGDGRLGRHYGARIAVIQSNPAGFSSSRMRALVDRAEHRGGVAVRQRAADADAVGGDGDPPFNSARFLIGTGSERLRL